MNILDVVKFDGLANGNWFVYKHYQEDLAYGSTLIVAEGQNAVFVKGGQISDIFNTGTHVLSTENLPILRRIANLPTGGKTPFSAEIFFVNTTTKMDLPWGLGDPIQLIDPKYGVRIRVRSFGQCGIKVKNSALLLQNVIGSLELSELISFNYLSNYFKGILITKVKTLIAKTIIENQISALEIATKLENLSEKITELLSPFFEQYGLSLVNFYINSINIPEEDLSKLTKILEDKASFDIIGDQRYIMKRSFDVYEGAANNTNGSAGLMMGGGLGLAMGMEMTNSMEKIKYENTSGLKTKCPNCQSEIQNDSKFCPNCGTNLLNLKCKCGAVINPNMKFCAECGTKI